MGVNCQVCKNDFDNDRSLHAHIKAHDMSLESYYHIHFPRHDLHSNELIKFENKEQYFKDNFTCLENYIIWIKSLEPIKLQEHLISLLTIRKKEKNLFWAPTQIEWRSLHKPSIITFNKAIGSYNGACQLVGYRPRFKDMGDSSPFNIFSARDKPVYIDTREQNKLLFDNFELKTLKVGDYAYSDRESTGNLYFERKSVADFISTISQGLDRFKEEIERAGLNRANLIVIIEEGLSKAMNFKSLPEISTRVKASPEYIFHHVRDLIQSYKHIQFLFVNGRNEAVRVMEMIWANGKTYQDYDIQLAYDLGFL
jgi:hypothetical protein